MALDRGTSDSPDGPREERVLKTPSGDKYLIDQHYAEVKLGEILPPLTRRARFRSDWLPWAGITVTVVIVLPATNFDFEGSKSGLTGAEWQTVILALLVISVLGLVATGFNAGRAWWRSRKDGPLTARQILDHLVKDATPIWGPPPAAAQTGGNLTKAARYVVGERVHHTSYGWGSIVGTRGGGIPPAEVQVHFDDGEEAWLITEFSSLTHPD